MQSFNFNFFEYLGPFLTLSVPLFHMATANTTQPLSPFLNNLSSLSNLSNFGQPTMSSLTMSEPSTPQSPATTPQNSVQLQNPAFGIPMNIPLANLFSNQINGSPIQTQLMQQIMKQYGQNGGFGIQESESRASSASASVNAVSPQSKRKYNFICIQ